MTRRIRYALRDGWYVTSGWVCTRYMGVRLDLAEQMVLPPMHGGKRLSLRQQTHTTADPMGLESFGEAQRPVDEYDEHSRVYDGSRQYIHCFTRRTPARFPYGRNDRLAVNQSWHYQMMPWADEVRITRQRAVYYKDGRPIGIIMRIIEAEVAS